MDSREPHLCLSQHRPLACESNHTYFTPETLMAISVPSKLHLSSFPSGFSEKKRSLLVVRCTPFQQSIKEDLGILCEPCNGKGWLLCSFCRGQKTNVKADNKRIYRRCPSCKAIGYVLCTNCKVFKCVTFPDFDDGEL